MLPARPDRSRRNRNKSRIAGTLDSGLRPAGKCKWWSIVGADTWACDEPALGGSVLILAYPA
jgi:hypothetical protein